MVTFSILATLSDNLTKLLKNLLLEVRRRTYWVGGGVAAILCDTLQFGERVGKVHIHKLTTISFITFLCMVQLTLREASVRGTSSPRTCFRKTLLNDKSMIRESSIAFATNCPTTRKI